MIGIDPGITGAIALIRGDRVDVWDMPVAGEGKGRYVDPYELGEILQGCQPYSDFACLEKVRSMPGQGVSSTFKFGHSYGVVQGLASFMFDLREVGPRQWKKTMKLTSSKEQSLALARSYWPLQNDLFKRKKDDGRAEAALIALYGLYMKELEDG